MKLAAYLREAGIRPSHFAKSLDLSPGTVADLCSGRRTPSLALLARIMEATGNRVTLNDFVPQSEDAA